MPDRNREVPGKCNMLALRIFARKNSNISLVLLHIGIISEKNAVSLFLPGHVTTPAAGFLFTFFQDTYDLFPGPGVYSTVLTLFPILINLFFINLKKINRKKEKEYAQ